MSRVKRKLQRILPYAGLLCVIAVFAAIVLWHLDFVPFYDGAAYYNCIADAVKERFDLLKFRCDGHLSILYLLYLSLPMYADLGNTALLYIANGLLGIASIVAFHGLLQIVFPAIDRRSRDLATALYALSPLFLAHLFHINLDFGLTVFFVLYLRFLLAGQFERANVFAVAMIFTKETGTPLYAVTLAAYIFAFILHAPTGWRQKLKGLWTHKVLGFPAVVLGLYAVYYSYYQTGSPYWHYIDLATQNDTTNFLLNTNLADPAMWSLLADVFALNFHWIYTIAIALCIALIALRSSFLQKKASSIKPQHLLFLWLVFIGLLYIVTRVRTWNNARYVLITSPIIILLFYWSLESILRKAVDRVIALALTLALVFASNFRTFDLVSIGIFGTFPFGSHPMLQMSTYIRQSAKDNIVYNLEFMHLHYILKQIMQHVKATSETIFFIGTDGIFFLPLYVDGTTFAPTARPENSYGVRMFSVTSDMTPEKLREYGSPAEFYYIEFPNLDNKAQLEYLFSQYQIHTTQEFSHSGYVIKLHTFTFRS